MTQQHALLMGLKKKIHCVGKLFGGVHIQMRQGFRENKIRLYDLVAEQSWQIKANQAHRKSAEHLGILTKSVCSKPDQGRP